MHDEKIDTLSKLKKSKTSLNGFYMQDANWFCSTSKNMQKKNKHNYVVWHSWKNTAIINKISLIYINKVLIFHIFKHFVFILSIYLLKSYSYDLRSLKTIDDRRLKTILMKFKALYSLINSVFLSNKKTVEFGNSWTRTNVA